LEDLIKANELKPYDVVSLKKCEEVKKMMDKYVDALEDLEQGS